MAPITVQTQSNELYSLSSTLNTVAERASETSVRIYQTARCHVNIISSRDKQTSLRVISGFRRDVNVTCDLPGRYTTYIRNYRRFGNKLPLQSETVKLTKKKFVLFYMDYPLPRCLKSHKTAHLHIRRMF